MGYSDLACASQNDTLERVYYLDREYIFLIVKKRDMNIKRSIIQPFETGTTSNQLFNYVRLLLIAQRDTKTTTILSGSRVFLTVTRASHFRPEMIIGKREFVGARRLSSTGR